MSDDIVDRLLASVKAARATDRSELLSEAATEIKSLRSKVAKKDKAIEEWTRRTGYHEGTLLGIASGCPDPSGVARRSLKRFGVK